MAKKMKLNIGNDGGLSVAELDHPVDEKRKVNLGGRVVTSENNKMCFLRENIYEDCDEFYNIFFQEITGMGLTAVNTDKVLKLSEKLIQTHKTVLLKILESENQANDIIVQIVNETSQYMTEQLKRISTAQRRLAQFRQNAMFVEPKEISLGLKWRTTTSSDIDLPSNKLVSSTCQFVSIIETLRVIFSQQEFQSMYVNYNSKEKHQCQDGVYMNFCCGSTYQSKPIFRDTNVIQIQIGMLFHLVRVNRFSFIDKLIDTLS